jgi:hypothetical protein
MSSMNCIKEQNHLINADSLKALNDYIAQDKPIIPEAVYNFTLLLDNAVIKIDSLDLLEGNIFVSFKGLNKEDVIWTIGVFETNFEIISRGFGASYKDLSEYEGDDQGYLLLAESDIDLETLTGILNTIGLKTKNFLVLS